MPRIGKAHAAATKTRWTGPGSRPLLLIRRGRVQHKHLRAEMITLAELRGHLRQHGVESFDEVESAWFESDGQFSVIKRDGEAGESAPKRRLHR